MRLLLTFLASIGLLRPQALAFNGLEYVGALLGRLGLRPQGLAPDGAPAFQPTIHSGADGKVEMHISGEIVDASMALYFGDAPGFVSSAGVAHALDKNKVERVVLNSVGGDVTEGTNIANQIRARGIPVVVNGAAYSIASVILAAAKSSKILPGSVVMVHKPHGCMCGNATAFRNTADALDTYEEAMLDIYVRGQNTEERRQYWRDAMTGQNGADGTYYTAAQAVAAGLADAVGEDDGQARARSTRARAALEALGMTAPKNLEAGEIESPAPTAPPDPRQDPATLTTVRGSVIPRGAVTLNTQGDK